MVVSLGFDLNCFTNRYVEPEAWTDLVAACGVHVVQFNFDLIDFTLPWRIQARLTEQTRACCAARQIRVKCAFGGHNHHQNYLGHPDNEVALAYEDYYRRMADVTAALGGEGFGTCFAITTVAVQRDPQRRAEVLERAVESYFRIAEHARGAGLQYLLYEMTSVPRETCATFAENDAILARLAHAAVPMRLCLDVGHRNQEVAGHPETDPYAWIRRYGRVAPLIHIQQCNADGSHHWPFTPPYNAKGDIQPERVLQAVADSGAQHEILLALEIRHRAYYPDEYSLEENLRRSVSYWLPWVEDPSGGRQNDG
jgi:D-erythrulose 1-phosphate 3-epimerase